MADAALQIVEGVPDEWRGRAVEILYDAFRQKFRPVMDRQSAQAVLPAMLQADQVLLALSGGEPVGLAGLQVDGRPLFRLRLGPFLSAFRPWTGLRTYLWMRFLFSGLHDEPLLLDSLCVDEATRGQGVGTRLLEAVFAYGRQRGHRAVWLEVVDTNPDAQRLYERLGFVATKTTRYPFARAMGFAAATTMRKDL
ncbi:MAG: GNAT family N-acetyltransferase [Chloroflexi bacterium]|nr:GNAT family N-acetyltransferase [Chloroflexota bacterium]